MSSGRWLFGLALASMVWLCASGQSVVSVHSGLLHFSDGAVFLDDQPVAQQPGRFPDIREGSELRTQLGRAEVLLTPGVFLRVGERSEIKMVSNRFRDTRIQFMHGSAIVESVSLSPDTAVTMIYPDSIYGDFQVRILKPGHYRFNSNPPEVRVYSGEAEVLLGARTMPVKEDRVLPFSPALLTERIGSDSGDPLDGWSQARSEAIAAGNAQSADTADLATVVDSWQNDPDPLSAYGMSGYGVGYGAPGYATPGYGTSSLPGYSSGLGYSPALGYNPVLGYSALGIGPVGIYGFGMPMYLPLYRYNAIPAYAGLYGGYGYRGYSYAALPGYRPITPIYRPGFAARPLGTTTYRPPAMVTPARSGVGTVRGIGHR
jgi:hypothetical protein